MPESFGSGLDSSRLWSDEGHRPSLEV